MDEPKLHYADINNTTSEGLYSPVYLHDDPAIVQALAFRKWAYENNLVGPDGQPRQIIGTLPVTADGCIFGDGTLWHAKLDREVTVEMFRSPDDKATGWQRGWQPFHYKHCYSTREAAERAAKGANDGQ